MRGIGQEPMLRPVARSLAWATTAIFVLVSLISHSSRISGVPEYINSTSLRPDQSQRSKLVNARPYRGEHAGLSLSEFIKASIGPADIEGGRGIWVSLADETYVRDFLSHARLYLDDLAPRHSFPRHDLVVLCLDAGCVYEGRKRRMLAYGGFINDPTKPDFVRTDTWAKAQGLSRILRAGYHTLFFDADVFLRWDVFDHLWPLTEDTWDLQIQDEVHAANLNTGFMFMRASNKTTELWQYVADQVTQIGLRDQAKVNKYLESTAGRTQPDGTRLTSFSSPAGLRVRVLPTRYFWGMHLAWFVDGYTTILHMTCATPLLKHYIAGAHGTWKDVDGLYSHPPRMLSLGTALGGSREDVAAMFKLLAALAISTGRAILPPLSGHVLGPANVDDGNLVPHGVADGANITHTRLLWSLIDVEPLLKPTSPIKLLEPNYPEHATPWLSGDHKTLLDLHTVREVDLRPINHYKELLRRLDEPYFRDARHIRLITDEGPKGLHSVWGGWEPDYPRLTPTIRPCATPERISTCGDLCRF